MRVTAITHKRGRPRLLSVTELMARKDTENKLLKSHIERRRKS